MRVDKWGLGVAVDLGCVPLFFGFLGVFWCLGIFIFGESQISHSLNITYRNNNENIAVLTKHGSKRSQ